jgi:hypothetical protein
MSTTRAGSEASPAAAAEGTASRPPSPTPVPKHLLAAPSREAKQRAAAILEVLAGGRTPRAAAQALGVSLTRYYLLEERALHGLLAACEPAPRGPHSDPERQRQALQAECARWQRECARQQALVRAAQRTIGLAAPAPPKDGKNKDGKKRRARKPVVRALQVAERLQQEAADQEAQAPATPPS